MATSLCPCRARRRRREASILVLVLTILLLRQYNLASKDLGSDGTGKTHRKRVRLEQPRSQMVSAKPRPQVGYVASLENIRTGSFTAARFLTSPGGEFLDVGMIVVGTKAVFLEGLRSQLESILTFSSGSPIHLLVITDHASVSQVGHFIGKILSRFSSMGVIQSPKWKWRRRKGQARVHISFVNIEDIVTTAPSFVLAMQNYSMTKDNDHDKYAAKLFYISPLYAKAFPGLEKLIFLDSSDLDFKDDIRNLWHQFDQMGAEAAVGMALDMSPHYRHFLQQNYTKTHPDTQLGLPGQSQGVNTGVVLFHLARLRASALYNIQVQEDHLATLVEEYGFRFSLGDQDWWTLLSWRLPELFYILPCRFNRQSSIQYLHPPWEDLFSQYHSCNKTGVVVIHSNGCGPTPELCGYNPPINSQYWGGRSSHLYEASLDTQLFFHVMTHKEEYYMAASDDTHVMTPN